jgi:DNA-binding transcriptional regulator YiaG
MDSAAQLIKQLRVDELGESCEIFARRIGCGLQTITRWEKTKRDPQLFALIRIQEIARQLGRDVIAHRFQSLIDTKVADAKTRFIDL